MRYVPKLLIHALHILISDLHNAEQPLVLLFVLVIKIDEILLLHQFQTVLLGNPDKIIELHQELIHISQFLLLIAPDGILQIEPIFIILLIIWKLLGIELHRIVFVAEDILIF